MRTRNDVMLIIIGLDYFLREISLSVHIFDLNKDLN